MRGSTVDERSDIITISPNNTDWPNKPGHTLYRCYTENSLLLYVGMTSTTIERRFSVHRCRSPWWKFVDHITLQSVPTRTRLAEAEAAAIELEKPAFNVITPPGISPQTVLHGRGHRVLWSDANNFCTVAPRDNEYLIDMTLEQQLFPCAECQARMICCEGDTVSCRLCGAEWAYDQWFAMTFADARQ